MTAETASPNADLLDPYLRYLRVDRGLSRRTLENYQADLRVFFGFLQEHGQAPLTVTRDVLTDYLWHRKSSGEKATSVARYISSLRSFYRYLASEEIIPKDPTALLQGPRKPERLPRYLTTEEINRLMGVLKRTTPVSIRLRGMLELMYAAGLRVSELVQLTRERIDLQVGYVRVFGKGGKERIVPIGERARLAVQAYLAIRPETPASEKSVFLSNRKHAMSAVQFWRLIGAAAREAGLDKPVNPHMLRHTFASHLVQNGADLRSVQEMLGHSSISTTQIYTHVGTRHLQQAHKRFHPRA